MGQKFRVEEDVGSGRRVYIRAASSDDRWGVVVLPMILRMD
jgi:hypothetical protein